MTSGDIRREPKWDKKDIKKKSRVNDESKLAIYKYYEAALAMGKTSEDVLLELEEIYGVSSRQLQRYISDERNRRTSKNIPHAPLRQRVEATGYRADVEKRKTEQGVNTSIQKKQELTEKQKANVAIDSCSWGSSKERHGQQISTIKVGFTFIVEEEPVNIAQLKLCYGKRRLQSTTPRLPIPQEGKKGCYTAEFELPTEAVYATRKRKRSKFQLCVVASGKQWFSEEFRMNYP